MVVILIKDVKGTGKAGDVVKSKRWICEKYAAAQRPCERSYRRQYKKS